MMHSANLPLNIPTEIIAHTTIKLYTCLYILSCGIISGSIMMLLHKNDILLLYFFGYKAEFFPFNTIPKTRSIL